MLELSERQPQWRRMALLFLFSYSFLLRTPSEALPAVAGGVVPGSQSNALLFMEENSLVLVLRRRKNKPEGSKLTRKCTCSKFPKSCVVHLLEPLLGGVPASGFIFDGISSRGAACVRQLCIGVLAHWWQTQ